MCVGERVCVWERECECVWESGECVWERVVSVCGRVVSVCGREW